MRVGDYVRTKYGEICQLKEPKYNGLIYSTDIEIDRYNDRDCNDYGFDNDTIKDIIKSSPNIIDLLQPMDLIYVDIDNNYAGGIIVPRIAETQAELNLMINLIKSGKWILKDVVTNEQLDSMRYEVGE